MGRYIHTRLIIIIFLWIRLFYWIVTQAVLDLNCNSWNTIVVRDTVILTFQANYELFHKSLPDNYREE